MSDEPLDPPVEDPSVELAGISDRLAARAIDWGVILAMECLFFLPLGMGALILYVGTGLNSDNLTLEVVVETVSLVASFVFWWSALGIILWSVFLGEHIMVARRGQTFGKRVMNIKVVDTDSGDAPSWSQSLLRFVVLRGVILTSLGFYLLVLCRRQHQGVHNRVARTRVVKTRSNTPPQKVYSVSTAGKQIELVLATRMRRFVAKFIDSWILIIAYCVLLGVFTILAKIIDPDFKLYVSGYYETYANKDDVIPIPEHVFLYAAVLVLWVFNIAMTAVKGQTFGKMITKIRVVRTDDASTPGWKKSAARWIVSDAPTILLSAVLLILMYGRAQVMGWSSVVSDSPFYGLLALLLCIVIMLAAVMVLTYVKMACDQNFQGAHDRWAGTLVVKGTSQPAINPQHQNPPDPPATRTTTNPND